VGELGTPSRSIRLCYSTDRKTSKGSLDMDYTCDPDTFPVIEEQYKRFVRISRRLRNSVYTEERAEFRQKIRRAAELVIMDIDRIEKQQAAA
jgi:hypothetical protein